MQLAEEIVVCFIRGCLSGLPKSRARERTWVQLVYLVGDASKQEAGTGQGETKMEKAKTSVIVKVTVKDSGATGWEVTPLGTVRSLECPPGGPGTPEHLPTCPYQLRVAPRATSQLQAR